MAAASDPTHSDTPALRREPPHPPVEAPRPRGLLPRAKPPPPPAPERLLGVGCATTPITRADPTVFARELCLLPVLLALPPVLVPTGLSSSRLPLLSRCWLAAAAMLPGTAVPPDMLLRPACEWAAAWCCVCDVTRCMLEASEVG